MNIESYMAWSLEQRAVIRVSYLNWAIQFWGDPREVI